MSDVIDLSQRRAERDAQDAYEQENGYWGLCPTCHRTDGCIDVGPNHWFLCDTHKYRWWIGANLFSAWRDASESQHAENAQRLAAYEETKPYHPEMRELAVRHQSPLDASDDPPPF